MNTFITLNIATGKVENYSNIESLIEGYCTLPLKEKLITFVLGAGEEAMDYPAMMDFMLDYNQGKPSMISYLMELDLDEDDSLDNIVG